MYISDLIQEDVTNWYAGDVVILDAPTGAGKTTAVLQNVRCEAVRRGKEVLMISNHKLLKKQIQKLLGNEIGWPEGDEALYTVKRFSGVTVMSYQEIQRKVKMGQRIVLADYSHVVFDEFHYLLADAMFQPEIFFFMQWLERCCALRNKILLLISATPEETWTFLRENCKLFMRCQEQEIIFHDEFRTISLLNERAIYEHRRQRKLWRYAIPRNFENVKPVFYREEQSLMQFICEDASSSKWIIFISQKKSGMKMYDQLVQVFGADEVLFLTADSVENDFSAVEEIVGKQMFSQKILITTKVMENGISIHDENLRNIVISTVWHDEFLQMLGRKRCKPEEEIKVFLPAKTLNSFNGLRNKLLLPLYEQLKVAPAERVDKILSDEEYWNFAKRFCIYDKGQGFYRLNPAGKYMIRKRMDFVDALLAQFRSGDDNAFVKKQLSWLQKSCGDNKILFLEEWILQEKVKKMTQFLAALVGTELKKEHRIEFRIAISKFVNVESKKNAKPLGLNSINRFLSLYTNYFVEPDYSVKPTVWVVKEK